MDANGKILQVRYKVYTFVERQDKLLVAKIDLLQKHAGQRKTLYDILKVKKNEYYYIGQNQHIKNKQIYYARIGETIVEKVAVGLIQECKKKDGSILHHVPSLILGWPICDYTTCQDLYNALNVSHQPCKHWFELAHQEIAHALAHVIRSNKHLQKLSTLPFLITKSHQLTTSSGCASLLTPIVLLELVIHIFCFLGM